jgi:hypothetical protein
MDVEGVGVRLGIDDLALSRVRLTEDQRKEEHRGRSKYKRVCIAMPLVLGFWVLAMAFL